MIAQVYSHMSFACPLGKPHLGALPVALVRRLLLLALLIALPLVGAQTAPPQPTFVVYHLSPDPHAGDADADPASLPGVMPDPAFPDASLPAARVDGFLMADPASEGAPESAPARFRELQRLVLLSEAGGAPITLEADGAMGNVTVRASGEASLVELHAVVVDGTLARAVLSPVTVNLSDGRANASWLFEAPPGARADRLGVAIWARLLEPVGTHARGEVAQSLLWRPGAAARAVDKQPLVEQVTASWCEACKPADDALGLMASRAAPPETGTGAYWRAPGVLTAIGLVVGLGAAWRLTRR